MARVQVGSLSITGNFRDNNEDRFALDPDGRFFLVADGMGGQSAGEKASEMATELLQEHLVKQLDFDETSSEAVIETIDQVVALANTEIVALAQLEPRFHNMGTTIVFVVAAGGQLYSGGVGDSRVYRLRDGDFEQLTTDHSLTQALLDAETISPEEAVTHRYRNVLYRYLGSKEGGEGTSPDVCAPISGDRFLLCSDGVTDGVDDLTLEMLVNEGDDPQQIAETIVEAAQQGGSKDNITAVVLLLE
ncbi:MAG TPA: serine/threonine-protein phosphatase [Planctomycetaceae bacterium]|nr:serine/threonine-protein phosphatase [Planctomycetaceae bacterium]HCD00017.1 serine/threonine-protein phosphatase [Planctomycetaceae bacterium]|tara:strand:+ start:3061 stop:3801 length:741 start_codon:yes stop_codon:yes gene_type:complete